MEWVYICAVGFEGFEIKNKMEEKEKYPTHIESNFNMSFPNEEIEICEGILVLKNEKNELRIKGNIIYKWFPRIGAEFNGVLISELNTLFHVDELDDYDLYSENIKLGEVFITEKRYFSTNPNKTIVTGIFKGNLLFSDKTKNVNKVFFSIPNFKSLFGNLTTFNNGNGGTRSRLSLENDKYNIEIDKSLDYDNKLRQLKNIGGFIILYSGFIKSKKGTFTISDTKSIFNCLDLFLTFLMGRRTSTIFHTGYFEEEKIWTDYSNKYILTYKNTESWTLRNSIDGIDELFKEFSTLWINENDKDFLKTVIHWYVEANNNSGFVEGSIIMAQTALELIYNWLLIEKKGLITGNDAENISASNKIRLILSEIKVDKKIPDELNSLKNLINSNNDYKNYDAPEIIVQIRNAIIHSQLKKREKLSKITLQAKFEALQIFIWYIELSILYILKYKGKYTNRCSKEQFHKHREIDVPWV